MRLDFRCLQPVGKAAQVEIGHPAAKIVSNGLARLWHYHEPVDRHLRSISGCLTLEIHSTPVHMRLRGDTFGAIAGSLDRRSVHAHVCRERAQIAEFPCLRVDLRASGELRAGPALDDAREIEM